jgi:adenylosuccinate synthase
MPVTVVVGGQFGSEGKGKVAHFLAREEGARFAIRVGGPNSGHTVIDESGSPLVLRQLPTAALIPNVVAILPAGSYINLQVFAREISLLGLGPDRVWIHPSACVITESHMAAERTNNLNARIGSTETGIGAAVRARTWRHGDVLLARDCCDLLPFVNDYVTSLRNCLRKGERVLVEGTQGFGLSVLHSPFYPYATSRDTTAAGFISEAGLSPLDVDEVVLVLRSFPIRVAGNSGPLPEETSWEHVSTTSGAKRSLIEFTSVTQRIRRVARFNAEIVKQAIAYNAPTHIVLNHVDYIDANCASQTFLTKRADDFVTSVEATIERQISYVGTGPNHLMDRLSASPREWDIA